MKRNAIKWISIAFLMQLALFIYLNINFTQNSPERIINHIFIKIGDTNAYFQPIEALMDGKGYSIEHYDDGHVIRKAFAGRMPGFLPVYGPLYLLLGSDTAKAIIIFLQFLSSILSIYVLARIAEKLFNEKAAFSIAFFLYGISSYVSIFIHYGLADSFGTSLLIFALYYVFDGLKTEKVLPWFIAGTLLCWAVFFRPILIVFFVVVPVLYIFKSARIFKIAVKIRNIVVFGMIVTLSLTAWSIRNFRAFDEFIPLQPPDSFTYHSNHTPQSVELRSLISAWGGLWKKWEPQGQWFVPPYSPRYIPKLTSENPFPNNIYTEDFNFDSLIVLREIYWRSMNPELSLEERMIYKEETILIIQKYVRSFKKNKPLYYHFWAPMKLTSKFLFQSRLDHFLFPEFRQMAWHQILVKGGYFIYYYFIIICGLMGMILIYLQKKRMQILFTLLPLSLIFIITIYLRNVEFRYFVPLYPFFVLFATSFLIYLFGKTHLIKSDS
ncbi:MAG: glycosyltransferase family 39 protein [Bacteroidetes bacterium]|nr:glycosyltransferase family 39 protein [Bacteroidota bacterium]